MKAIVKQGGVPVRGENGTLQSKNLNIFQHFAFETTTLGYLHFRKTMMSFALNLSVNSREGNRASTI